MSLRNLKNRLKGLAAKLPPAPMRPAALVIMSKFDPGDPPKPPPIEKAWQTDALGVKHPIPADTDVDSRTCWHYKNSAELAALRERFEREYGDHTRAPGEPANILVDLVDADEIEARNARRSES